MIPNESTRKQRARRFGRLMDRVDGDWQTPAWAEWLVLRIYMWLPSVHP